MSIFKILKNALEFVTFCPKDLSYQKIGFHDKKMWAGCYQLLPPTIIISESGLWPSLSRYVLDIFISPIGPLLDDRLKENVKKILKP